MPSVVRVGERLPIRAQAEAGDPTLALQAVVMRENSVIVEEPPLLDSDGEGGYDTRLSGLAAGIYRIRVESAVPQRPVEPVTDITLVWDSAAGA
jgi:hypothetical protein